MNTIQRTGKLVPGTEQRWPNKENEKITEFAKMEILSVLNRKPVNVHNEFH